MFGPGIDAARLHEKLQAVPYEAALLVKLHKRPLELRFLACSAQNGLQKPPSIWLTALLRSVQPDLEILWTELLSKAGVTYTQNSAVYCSSYIYYLTIDVCLATYH